MSIRSLRTVVFTLALITPAGAITAQGAQPAPAGTAAAAARDLSGTWDFAVVTENGTGTPTVVLKQEGTKVTGTYESGRMGVRALKGSIAGDSITFALEGGDSPVTLVFRGAIRSAGELTGVVEFAGMGGGATFTGTRRRTP